jgi:biopolymer transport protein ExbB/TolQ
MKVWYVVVCGFIFALPVLASKQSKAEKYLAEANRSRAMAKRYKADAKRSRVEANRSLADANRNLAEAKRSRVESQGYLAECNKWCEQSDRRFKRFMTFYATIAITAPILIIAGAKGYNLNPFPFLNKVFFKS